MSYMKGLMSGRLAVLQLWNNALTRMCASFLLLPAGLLMALTAHAALLCQPPSNPPLGCCSSPAVDDGVQGP